MRFLKIAMVFMLVASAGLYGFKPKKNNMDTFYVYVGTSQLVSARSNSNNYRSSTTNPCGGGANECGVMLAQDYGLFPNFRLVSFNTTTGMPDGGLDFVANYTKL
jgi:hypothetical protein